MAKSKGRRWTERLGRGIDSVVGLFNPRAEIQRRAARYMLSSYRAAESHRLRRGPRAKQGSADYHADKLSRDEIRERTRDAERNNPLVAGIIDKFVTNIVADGFMLQARTADEEFNKRNEERFANWREAADITGQFNLDELAALACRSVVRDGDVGFVMATPKSDRGRLQPIESERIDDPDSKKQKAAEARGHSIENGIEVDAAGLPVGYWVGAYDSAGYSISSASHVYYPARDFLFLFRPQRASQSRGVSVFAPVLDVLQMIDDYRYAELARAQVAACFGVAIKTNTPLRRGNLPPGITQDEDEAGNTQFLQNLEPGLVKYLDVSEEIQAIDPRTPATDFGEFMKVMLRFCMFTLGMSYEIYDITEASWAGARAGLLQTYKTFRCWQSFLTIDFYERVYRWKTAQFIKYGDVAPPDPGLVPQGAEYAHDWIAPSWDYVDPRQDIAASAMAIARGLSNLSRECAQAGTDYIEQVLPGRVREIEAAQEAAKKLGIDWRELAGIPAATPGVPRGRSEPHA